MTHDQLHAFMQNFFSECLGTAQRKGNDYAGTVDPFKNFRSVGILGIDPEDGFLTRMMDKVMRVANLIHAGNRKVMDESIQDTLHDLANYTALLAAFLNDQELKGIHAPTDPFSEGVKWMEERLTGKTHIMGCDPCLNEPSRVTEPEPPGPCLNGPSKVTEPDPPEPCVQE